MSIMQNLRDLWHDAGAGARSGLILGATSILAVALWMGSTLLNTEYGVLFAGLNEQDAASVVSELDRLKIPYRFGKDESTLLVPAEQVHTTRLKLMGKGVALHGGVGFEIFNNTDFGMTEFAQKINYQRALQGELTRTIMAFDAIKSARVHLVLPESGLFKKANQKPKASITLALKQGRTLQPEQVLGIQRLVAASMPEIREDAVTVLDQRGVALSRAPDVEGDAAAAGARFAIKNDIEAYLAKKAITVLDGTFGPGKAMVSVDVTLNLDQVKVTQEDVLPSNGRGGEATGTVVRRRISTQGNGKGFSQTRDWQDQDAVAATSSTQEVEYQSGRRVEQIVSRPGSIRHISVGVMLPHALARDKVEEIRQVLAMAVGLNSARGDEIALSSVDRFASDAVPPAAPVKDDGASLAPPAVADAAAPAEQFAWSTSAAMGALVLLITMVVMALSVFHNRHRRQQMERERVAERERLLSNVRQWLQSDRAVLDAEQAP